MKITVIPSLLVKNKRDFSERLKVVSRYSKTAQIDVLDGSFLSQKSFHDSNFINSLHPKINFELHLMINGVLGTLSDWNRPWIKKIIFHQEAVKNHLAVIKKIKSMGKKTGMALNPETPLQKVFPYLKYLDTVLLMTVYPGRNGAKFLPQVLEKIRSLRNFDKKINIEVDGGVNPETARLSVKAGANILVTGSYLQNKFFQDRLKTIKRSI